jgi:hypothetical protein
MLAEALMKRVLTGAAILLFGIVTFFAGFFTARVDNRRKTPTATVSCPRGQVAVTWEDNGTTKCTTEASQ